MHPEVVSANAPKLAEYIDAQIDRKELTSWTVAVVSNTRSGGTPHRSVQLGDLPEKVVTVWRKPAIMKTKDSGGTAKPSEPRKDVYEIRQGRIVDPSDEHLDFDETEEAYKRALSDTINAWEKKEKRSEKKPVEPAGEWIRKNRKSENGLLIIYPLYPPEDLYGKDLEAVIGYAVSFPDSPTAEGVEYRVGDLYLRQLLGGDDDDD